MEIGGSHSPVRVTHEGAVGRRLHHRGRNGQARSGGVPAASRVTRDAGGGAVHGQVDALLEAVLGPNSIQNFWLDIWLEIPYTKKLIKNGCFMHLRIKTKSPSVFQAETQANLFLLNRLPAA